MECHPFPANAFRGNTLPHISKCPLLDFISLSSHPIIGAFGGLPPSSPPPPAPIGASIHHHIRFRGFYPHRRPRPLRHRYLHPVRHRAPAPADCVTVWRWFAWSGVWCRVCGVGCESAMTPQGNGRKPQQTAVNGGELSGASVGVVRGEDCANIGGTVATVPPRLRYPVDYLRRGSP